jgi:hypothetical protein
VVLRAFMGFPFEPMDKVSLKYLTFKTVFLVALATAQSRSELHALAFTKTAFREDGWGNPRIHPRIPGEDPGG